MPTYEYVCTDCGTPLEAQQGFNDPPLTRCPNCTGRLRKVYSAVGVVFKGSGFYRTDSRGSEPTGEKPDSVSGSKPEGKPDRKPDESSPASTGTASTGTASAGKAETKPDSKTGS